MWRVWLSLGLLMASPVVARPGAAVTHAQAVSVGDLIGQYAGGEFSAATTFAALPDRDRAVRTFEDQARRWIQADRGTLSRRRVIAATFALDVARQWLGSENPLPVRRLLAWGCAQLRSNAAPDALERLWHLAAVAVIEGGDDWLFLVGRERTSGRVVMRAGADVEGELTQGHLSHALARFPAEPRFVLAAVVAADMRNWEVGGYGRDLNVRGGLIAGEIDRTYVDRLRAGDILADDGTRRRLPGAARIAETHVARVRDVQAIAARYDALTKDASLAGEAHLRSAFVQYRLAERDVALQHLAEVQRIAHDPYLMYLAHLFTGVIRERQGRDEDAIEAYWAALNLVPRAQSATSLLVARLFGAGRQAEAAALTDAFFGGGEPTADPWRTYRLGDFRLLSSFLSQLHAGFR